jgi:glycerophosphoryl diester phosphodiesterase
VRVIGHRGARRLAVENTVESLRIALQEGADGVEFDVQQTADGELVLFHDDDLRRLCGQRGRITALPWRDVRDLRVRQPGLPEARIAHLDQVIELTETRKAWVDCEIKVDAAIANGAVLADALARRLEGTATTRWMVSSFDRLPLQKLDEAATPVLLAALVDGPPSEWWQLARTAAKPAKRSAAREVEPEREPRLFAVNPAWQLVDPERMAMWRGRGWQVWPWTVNGARRWDAMVTLGVDAIITDEPGELVRFCAESGVK